MSNQKVVVVTGSSSGIGRETSLLLARKGFQTFATMRNLSKSSVIDTVAEKEGLPLHVVKLDVNDDNSVTTAIQQILSKVGRIDVLINCCPPLSSIKHQVSSSFLARSHI